MYMKVLTSRKVGAHPQHVEYIGRIDSVLHREWLVYQIAVRIFGKIL
jgi:hypothetical protein